MDKPKVLVIDDERGPRESLRMILKDEYEVEVAQGPEQGLRLVDAFRPDVVFLDIRMPQMDGTEVLRRIKELDPEIEDTGDRIFRVKCCGTLIGRSKVSRKKGRGKDVG